MRGQFGQRTKPSWPDSCCQTLPSRFGICVPEGLSSIDCGLPPCSPVQTTCTCTECSFLPSPPSAPYPEWRPAALDGVASRNKKNPRDPASPTLSGPTHMISASVSLPFRPLRNILMLERSVRTVVKLGMKPNTERSTSPLVEGFQQIPTPGAHSQAASFKLSLPLYYYSYYCRLSLQSPRIQPAGQSVSLRRPSLAIVESGVQPRWKPAGLSVSPLVTTR